MATFAEICAVLRRHYSASSAQTIARMATRRIHTREHEIPQIRNARPLLSELRRGMDLFSAAPPARRQCLDQLEKLFSDPEARLLPKLPALIEVTIIDESHIVEARTKARAMATEIGFSRTEQVKVATIASELARNIYYYAGLGVIAIRRLESPQRGIEVEARDEGPGIDDVESLLAGSYRSRTGLGLGLIGCRNLSNEFAIDTGPGLGTRVNARMYR